MGNDSQAQKKLDAAANGIEDKLAEQKRREDAQKSAAEKAKNTDNR